MYLMASSVLLIESLTSSAKTTDMAFLVRTARGSASTIANRPTSSSRTNSATVPRPLGNPP